METFILDILTTILGVVTGGLITLYITNKTNVLLIKKEHQLEILQKVKLLLNGWRNEVTAIVTDIIALDNIEDMEYKLSPNLQSLIVYFEYDLSVLRKFKKDFDNVRNKKLKFQLEFPEWKKGIITKAKEKNELNGEKLLEYKLVFDEYEKLASHTLTISEEIEKLILSIDSYIEKEIF